MLQEGTHCKLNTSFNLHSSNIMLCPKERHASSNLKEAVECCCFFNEGLFAWLRVVSDWRVVRLVVVDYLF